MYIFLPGNNKENKQWCESLRDSFEGKNEMIYYNHWNGEGNINWDIELEKIKNLNITEKVNIVGKSAGCILGIKALNMGYIDVNKFVFIGFPYNWALQRGDNVDELLNYLKTPSLFIQKAYDPVIGYDELVKTVINKGLDMSTLKYQRTSEVENNHNYDDVSYLKDIITDFINT